MPAQPGGHGPGRAAVMMAVLCLYLPGCSLWSQDPAPVVRYGAESGVGNTGVHTVDANDTLWNISQRYRISMPDLVLANKLSAPYALKAGQRLLLPPPQAYRVREDDSLYTISRLFNISTTQLARLNDLSAPYKVRPGQTLRLPAVTPPEPLMSAPSYNNAGPVPVMTAHAPGAITAETLAPPPGQPSRFGDSVQAAAGYAGGYDDLPQPVVPPLSSSGQVLSPPPSSPFPPSSAPAPSATLAVGALPSLPTPGDYGAAPRTGGRFEWPVTGRILSSYGPKAGGEHNDGINIAVARGAPVRAAEAGTVVYADNELKGFGNLILIRHPDRWMTAYAHLDGMHVRNGDKVTRGQVIGLAGSTGSVGEPQLHFEVRRGTEALNPELFLAKLR